MQYLLSHAIDETAARTPDHDAIRCMGDGLTYAELADQSDRLAHVLIEQGVRRGDRVGLYLDKGLRAAVAIYGILKAGAAYVPLDPAAPVARLGFILRDCGIRHLITEPSKRATLIQFGEAGIVLDACVGVDATDGLPGRAVPWDTLDAAPAGPPVIAVTEQDLAYILYTSGSTGVPKGVMHTHRSALSWATIAARTYGFRPDDRISNHAPLHFDLSTLDYFATAAVGATTLVIPHLYTKMPASLSALMESERLTVLYVVPLALTQLLMHGALDTRDLSALRWVLFGGEPLPPKYLRGLMAAWPHARFSNVYGPTEVNGVTYHVIPHSYPDHETEEPIPIGRTFGNVDALVVDGANELVEIGEPGELIVRTPTMMRGYWGRPDLNATAFAHRPAFDHYEDTYHKTGDLVREQADGAYQFLGRKDRQIKVRGYRVELAEIEAVLSAHGSVSAAAAFGVPNDLGIQRIEAAVIAQPGTTLAAEDLRQHAESHLPAYAIPEAIDIVDRFPETSTGKIDRLALQAQASARPPTARS